MRLPRLTALLAAGATCWAALAATSSWAQVAPGRLVACGACHGADGQSQIKDIPSLAAQPIIFIENQLVLIREGVRDVPQMKGLLEGVSDAEISALAKYYAGLAAPKATPRGADPLYAKGETLAREARCGICHLPNYLGREQIPRLAGQREDYLLHSMRQFVAGQATGRDSNMAASLHGISDADLKALSHYLARVVP